MTNVYSTRSKAELNTLHWELQVLLLEVLPIQDHSIVKGWRSEEEQHAAFVSGNSKLDWPNGNHNKYPSNAVDITPYIPGIRIDGNNPKHLKYFYFLAGVVVGVAERLYAEGKIRHSVRWGGDWDTDRDMDDQSFNDLYHFELARNKV